MQSDRRIFIVDITIWILLIAALAYAGKALVSTELLYLYGAGMFASLAGLLWMRRRLVVAARYFRALTGPECIRCGYSMVGHREGAVCPECRHLYQKQTVEGELARALFVRRARRKE